MIKPLTAMFVFTNIVVSLSNHADYELDCDDPDIINI